MISERPQSEHTGWKWTLLGLCALSLIATFAITACALGLGSRPWYGWWDANDIAVGQPYVVAVAQPRPGGASARAGLRDGDRIDLREQNITARIAVVYQPMATERTFLKIHRGSSALVVGVDASTVWEGEPLWKVPPTIARPLAGVWFIICAMLIALRRWWSRDARMLALVLLLVTCAVLEPSSFVAPSATLRIVFLVFARACAAAASFLLVKLASYFGVPSAWRANLNRFAYGVIVLGFLADVLAAIGLLTLWIDPLQYIFRISAARGALDVGASLLVAALAAIAVAKTPPEERPRAAWLLLPLPLAFLISGAVATLVIFIHSWFANVAVIAVSDGLILFGALIVTYALLKRRVLDFDFVLGRTLVVATVSLIVVASFVMLEWLLGTILAGVSHATGLIANGALALVLGLSINFIHKRVDAFIDTILFRKRHEDERSLLDFSKEAAYVTEREALLDRAIEKIERHTDARGVRILLEGSGEYATARSFGDATSAAIVENDAAILALKTWHKPLDPHQYETELRGALALPMLARGRLLGVLILGERAGGEAYAPDEVAALSQLAHGVGLALNALSVKPAASQQVLLEAIRALPDAITARLRDAPFQNP